MAAGTEITQPVSFTERASGTGPAAACCGKARVGSIQLRCFRGSTESFALLSANGKDLVIPEEPEEPDFVADSGSERGAETATSAMQSKPPRFTRTLFEESLSMKSSSNSAESLFLEDSCRVQLEEAILVLLPATVLNTIRQYPFMDQPSAYSISGMKSFVEGVLDFCGRTVL